MYDKIKQSLEIKALQMRTTQSFEYALFLAVFGLLQLTKTAETHNDVSRLQIMSGHLSIVFSNAEKTDELDSIEQDFIKIKALIDQKYIKVN